VHELCALLAGELRSHKGSLGGGILLTGGGAEVKGITEYFYARLHVPVARARPVLGGEADSGLQVGNIVNSRIHPTKFATVIGLLNLELGRVEELAKAKRNNWSNRYLGQFVNWLRELS
jgi:cell division ATPase FtsA